LKVVRGKKDLRQEPHRLRFRATDDWHPEAHDTFAAFSSEAFGAAENGQGEPRLKILSGCSIAESSNSR
jgi:hypothetical protein